MTNEKEELAKFFPEELRPFTGLLLTAMMEALGREAERRKEERLS